MQLYVIRHAIALDREIAHTDGLQDEQRPLTERGISRFKAEVRGLARIGIRFDRVLYSPWRRALETAELLRPVSSAQFLETESLARGPGETLLDDLAAVETAEHVAVVGHEPWLSELIAWLAFEGTNAGWAIEMKKGAVAHLSGPPRPGAMCLRALLPPKLLRTLS